METLNIDHFKTAVSYLHLYRGETFVIRLKSEIIEDKALLHHFCEQVALLHLLGIRIVLVHGSASPVSKMSEKLHVETEAFQGRSIVSKEDLEVFQMVSGKLNADLLAGLRKYKASAVGISGVDGGLITASKPSRINHITEDHQCRKIDFGFAGDLKNVNPALIHYLLDGGFIPVVSPLGFDDEEDIYQLDADEVAAELSVAMKAKKLIFMAEVDGVLKDSADDTSLFAYIPLSEINDFIALLEPSMVKKIRYCAIALNRGVSDVHVINGFKPNTLLIEIFTTKGAGTIIHKDR